jgi:hypothetical protein
MRSFPHKQRPNAEIATRLRGVDRITDLDLSRRPTVLTQEALAAY